MKENFSWPSDFISRIQARKGLDVEAFLNSLTTDAPASIRLNPAKTTLSELSGKFQTKLQAIPWSETGLYLEERPSFTLMPIFHAGHFYVQEASSMLLEQAIIQTNSNKEGKIILDACAAPGGKSTHLLSMIANDTLLISNEVIKSRAQILHENICKWGNSNVLVTNTDPHVFGKIGAFLDAIVVDAPCSGEGLFRKDNSAVDEWSENNAQLCAQRQTRILEDLWPALKENGYLIYSTCTFNPEENENNLKRFIKKHEAESIELNIKKDWGIETVQIEDVTGYYCYPHMVKGEGFFLSVLQKKSAANTTRLKTKKSVFTSVDKKNNDVKNWIKDGLTYTQYKDQILAMPGNQFSVADYLAQHVYLISCGLHLGDIKQNKVIPAQTLAFSYIVNTNVFPTIALPEEEALQFLRKDQFTCAAIEAAPNGFNLITCEKANLGFINKISNRYNNLYPSEWRIRMELK
jgi:16S rRNA C967 or C1407 C5-methylase (RsmB/RsmF family)